MRAIRAKYLITAAVGLTVTGAAQHVIGFIGAGAVFLLFRQVRGAVVLSHGNAGGFLWQPLAISMAVLSARQQERLLSIWQRDRTRLLQDIVKRTVLMFQ